ncbi:SLATT domain-containing protein [Stutzerimonas balearica]|uniref:SLATT domain-containing protein n=1 Tax=Stutzerimonas balearica TaxID=74829 RepID=UPI001BC97D39|nr:SLATT domain-containing protein [Stutzerimonas balearica]MBS4150163.1 SLATT domain-containing protein [Stutzerimonas balearica]
MTKVTEISEVVRPQSDSMKKADVSEKGLRAPKTPADKLLLNMRVTSNCRYRAAIRLGMKNDISFVATTVLSLGLILIPLLQNSGMPLQFPASVANGMQLFFAVCVLVYSVIISKAGYGVRSEKLNRCGDDLKSLARDLEHKIKADNENIDVKGYGERYSIIVSSSENHEDNDYLISRLHMSRDYEIKGWRRFYYELKSRALLYSMYITPLSIIVLELAFLSDFIGASDVYPNSFKVNGKI